MAIAPTADPISAHPVHQPHEDTVKNAPIAMAQEKKHMFLGPLRHAPGVMVPDGFNQATSKTARPLNLKLCSLRPDESFLSDKSASATIIASSHTSVPGFDS